MGPVSVKAELEVKIEVDMPRDFTISRGRRYVYLVFTSYIRITFLSGKGLILSLPFPLDFPLALPLAALFVALLILLILDLTNSLHE